MPESRVKHALAGPASRVTENRRIKARVPARTGTPGRAGGGPAAYLVVFGRADYDKKTGALISHNVTADGIMEYSFG